MIGREMCGKGKEQWYYSLCIYLFIMSFVINYYLEKQFFTPGN